MPEKPESIQLDDVLITAELSRRSPRQPNLQAENQAMRSLARQLTQAPEKMLQNLVDLALDLCDAGTAGVSLLETQPDGEEVFHWVAMAGDLAACVGDSVSRADCPCGVCLERGEPLLFAYPERYFTQFQPVTAPLVESLLLPLMAEGQALGTIWITTHDEQRQFDSEDVRLMTGLADFTAASLLRSQQQATELLVANQALKTENTERQLAEARSLALIDNLPGGAVFIIDHDLRYTMAAGEALAVANFQPQDFVGRTIFEVLPAALAATYEPMYRAALAGESFEHEHQAHNRWYISRGTPLRAENGEIYGALAVSYDITDRKCAETQMRRTAELDAFRVKLSDALRSLADPVEIQAEACYLLGAHLQVDRAYYVEINGTEGYARVARDYLRGDSPSLVGTYPLAKYSWVVPYLRRGETVTVTDTATDAVVPDADREPMAALQIQAHISLPILKRGELVGALCVTDCLPRQWSAAEVELVNETAERIWWAIQQTTAEMALQQSEAKYRSLFNSIDEGFVIAEVIYNEAGQPVDALYLEGNPAASRFTGVPDFSQRRLSEVSPDFEDYWVATYDRVLKTGVSERTEQYAAPLGRWYDFYVCPFRTPSDSSADFGSNSDSDSGSDFGGDQRVAIIFQDISDRKRAEATVTADLRDTQRLRELSVRLTSEEDIQVLYNEIMAAAIALTQADAGTVQIFDAAAQDLVLLANQGFEPDFINHFHRVNASSQTSCGFALSSGQRVLIDFDDSELNDVDGSLKIHVEAGYRSAQSTPLITRSGHPIGMVSTHWRYHYRPSERELRFLDLLARQAADLIEQRQAELERRQLLKREQAARAEAERANRVKDEFLAILSHELRSPLNPVLGWTKLLQTQTLDPQKTQQALSTIERNVRLQTQLIDDLLDVARILRGKLKIEATIVNLATVIEAALEVVRNSAEAKGISLQLNLVEICEVTGDEGRLQQVIWNLLSNAIKFTPMGGQVIVRLDTLHDQAQVTVTDTGKGIRPEFLPYLFQAFLQEDVSTTRQYGGLGLGLSIAKYIVNAHGGSIAADSPGEGQGATFTVQIPLRREQSILRSPALAPSANLDLTGIKVLVVDDNEDTRELLTIVLTQYGGEVTVAASGPEGLAYLTSFQPDVLICDISMPNMNGYDLLQQIRTRSDPPGQSYSSDCHDCLCRSGRSPTGPAAGLSATYL